jgi:hypothetical protein
MSIRNNDNLEGAVTLDSRIQGRAVSETDAALYIGSSVSTLRKGRMEGNRTHRMPPPPYIKLGRKILYLIDDLDRYLESNRVNAQGSACEGSRHD